MTHASSVRSHMCDLRDGHMWPSQQGRMRPCSGRACAPGPHSQRAIAPSAALPTSLAYFWIATST